MIETYDIKQKLREVFTLESPSPRETILIVGSCRSVPYLNYLDRYNKSSGHPLRVHFIDPFNYHWDGGTPEKWVNYEDAINALENNPRILGVLGASTIFIHEYYQNFGMFNTSRESPKNIHQFGLNPRMDICIPNFHDVNILGASVDAGLAAIEKFCANCRLTSFPEMAQHFLDHWRTTRFFWTENHVSKHFTLFVFRQMNARFLHLDLDAGFWAGADSEDMYSEPRASVTEEDRKAHGIQW